MRYYSLFARVAGAKRSMPQLNDLRAFFYLVYGSATSRDREGAVTHKGEYRSPSRRAVHKTRKCSIRIWINSESTRRRKETASLRARLVTGDYELIHTRIRSWGMVTFGDLAPATHRMYPCRFSLKTRMAWHCRLGLVCAILMTQACRPQPRTPTDPPLPPYAIEQPDQLPAQLTIPLREYNGYLRTPTRVNGQDAGVFLIDTGSTQSIISLTTASGLNLPKGRPGVTNGIAGQETFIHAQVQTLSIGELLLHGRELPMLNLHRFHRPLGEIVGGIVGFSAFGGVPFTIDYQPPSLTVYQPSRFQPHPEAQAHRLWLYRGIPVIRAVVGNGHAVWLMIDTGSDKQVTLPRSCLTRWPDIVLVPQTGRGQSKGIGGTIGNVNTWLDSITLLGLELRQIPVSFEPDQPTPSAQKKPIGRIGGNLLKHFRLTFDPTHQRIWVHWLPKG